MVHKHTVAKVAEMLKAKPRWVPLFHLEATCGSDAREAVDVLHWAGVLRSRENEKGDDLEYSWVK